MPSILAIDGGATKLFLDFASIVATAKAALPVGTSAPKADAA